jgi:hypothetical protein
MIRDCPEALVFVDFNLLSVADSTLLLAVLVSLLCFESVDPFCRTKLPDLSTCQQPRTTDDEFSVQVNLNDRAKMLLFMKFDFLIVADYADVTRHNLGPESIHPILVTQLTDLTARKTPRTTRNFGTVEDDFDSVMMLVFRCLIRLVAFHF